MEKKTIYHHHGELQTGWSFWENYRPAIKEQNQTKSFSENLSEIFQFDNLNKFAQFWNGMPYDCASNLIYFPANETEKKIRKNDRDLIIEGLNLFRKGVRPEWEDPANQKGYHFQCELDVQPHTYDLVSRTYDDLWKLFVFSLIGEECEASEEITGMRQLYKQGRFILRVEIWIRESLPNCYKKKLHTNNPENENDENKRKKTYD